VARPFKVLAKVCVGEELVLKEHEVTHGLLLPLRSTMKKAPKPKTAKPKSM
jgi:hypothetical protein